MDIHVIFSFLPFQTVQLCVSLYMPLGYMDLSEIVGHGIYTSSSLLDNVKLFFKAIFSNLHSHKYCIYILYVQYINLYLYFIYKYQLIHVISNTWHHWTLDFDWFGRYKMETLISFNFNFLNDYLKYSFMFFPSVKCGKCFCAHFLLNFIFVRNSSYILDSNLLSVLCLANNFSPLEAIMSLFNSIS